MPLPHTTSAVAGKDYETDAHGEALALSGDLLYPTYVSREALVKKSTSAFGAGRLQRLWLASSGASAVTASTSRLGEKRLRRNELLRLGPDEDGDAPAK